MSSEQVKETEQTPLGSDGSKSNHDPSKCPAYSKGASKSFDSPMGVVPQASKTTPQQQIWPFVPINTW